MTPHDDPEWNDEAPNGHSVWQLLGRWPAVVALSLLLLLLTFNPFLTGLLPYLRAGWPAVQTGFWLKRTDPWKARGTVGFLFHLCMAGFRAGVFGFAFSMVTAIVASFVNPNVEPPIPMMAIGTIIFSCAVSAVLGWIGILIALRHGIRVFVKSDLYKVCRGDFAVAATLQVPPHQTINPANFIVALAVGVPTLVIWCITVMIVINPAQGAQLDGRQQVMLWLLLLIPVAIIAVVMYLYWRIVAKSPAECWGAEVPQQKTVERNWYRVEE